MGTRKLFDEKSVNELLEEFRQSGSNEPFEEIVRRYAAMVFGVCLRVTGDKHDAEDATQAVFLSLALQAKTDRQITYVGPWLQKVAHRLALDIKKSKTRRKRREEKVAEMARHNGNGHNGHANGHNGAAAFVGGNGHANPADKPGAEELKQIMMEELNQLPAKYRMPLVMHYFGGLSREEMSEQLGCNPSTLGVRVHRGKAMLGTRLAKRGLAISAISMAVVLEHVVRDAAIVPIVSTASASASGLVASAGFGAPLAAAKVMQLVRTAARAVAYAKVKYAVVMMLVITSAAFATGSGIVQQIKAHLPSLNLTEWIKPFFRSFVPNLRADSGEADPLAGASAPALPEPKINLDRAGYMPAPTPPGSYASASAKSAAPAQQPSPIAPQPPAELNSLARAVLNPPISFRPLPLPAKHDTAEDLMLGADSEQLGTDPETAEPTRQTLAASSDGSFSLGAGGGGGGGKPEVYVMPANASMTSSSMTIGASGPAFFHQLGGVNRVSGSLVLGQQNNAVGVYQMDGGSLIAKNEIIGDEGCGAFIQTRGINRVSGSIIVGNAGSGSYEQTGGEVVVENKPVAVTLSDLAAASSNSRLILAAQPGSQGSWTLADGSLDATPQVVGNAGDGAMVQSGGYNTTGSLQLALQPGSSGTYTLSGGKLLIHREGDAPASAADVAIRIGGKGYGVFTFGNSQQTGAITEVGGHGSSVVVRGEPTAAGAIRGWGKIDLPGVLVNNGQIIADGYRRHRSLDLSSFESTTTSIENPRWGGANGWFARRNGELKLPAIPVKAGTDTYTWGEDSGDAMIDLVNSVRIKVHNARQDGDVSIALMSILRTDIPTLPQGHHFIGVWSFDGSELDGFDGVDLEVRYDDAAAASLGLDEEILKLWRYNPTDLAWHRIMDDSFRRDTLDHIIAGYAPGDLSYFAVSAPEPGGAMMLVIGAAALLRRRRRA